MIVVRFKVSCRSERVEERLALLSRVVGPSRRVEGVVSFDVGRDVADPNSFVATEVFEDADALARQESLPEVAAAMQAMETALVGEPEATIFHVASTEPYGD